MNKLIELDKWLFVKINRDATSPFLDNIMPFVRQAMIWIPLYLFLIVFFIINFPKKAAGWLISLGFTAAISDVISSWIIKPLVGRARPCNDQSIMEKVNLLTTYCGQNGSFTSSHATNHFAVATFLFITLRSVWGNYNYLFIAWALMIGYAQIYVGVHFPGDIIGGVILGWIIGKITASIYINKWGLPDLSTSHKL
jgi:membrane-associated phospholipid phosphatase